MAQRPSTPVRVPSSAANHTPAVLDPDLRSHINTVLLRDGHVSKIQDALLHSLNANPSNWPAAIQSHALALLRSGEITTFPALLRRVLDDIRHDSGTAAGLTSSSSAASATSAASSSTSGSSSPSSTTNGSSSVKIGGDQQQQQQKQHQNGKKMNGNGAAAGETVSLAVPGNVVEEALRATRECLEAVCEIDDKA